MSTIVGTIELIAKIDTSQYKRGVKDIQKSNQDIENSSEQASSRSGSSFIKMGAAIGAAMAVAQKVISSTISMVTNAISGAVRRVDTLNNAGRTFQNLGFGADVTRKSMKNLEASIKGLPTPLDSAVRGMTSLSATYGDINKGQQVFSALNNAILGFGGSTAEVENAITQLSQLPMDGPLDAQTWNSLRNSGLTPVLRAMAKESGMSVSEMKEAFGDGELTVQDFTNKLISLNKKGGGGMQSLEKIVKDSTAGMQTGWANFQTSIVRGVAKIIEGIGSANISKAFSTVGTTFENVLKSAAALIPKIVEIARQVADYLAPKFQALGNTLSQGVIPLLKDLWKNVIQPLIPVIGTTLVLAIGAVVDILNGFLTGFNWVIEAIKNGNPIIIALIGTFAALAAVMAFNKIFNALTIGFNTLRLITIPKTMASIGAMRALVASPVAMGAIAVGAALGAIALVVKAIQSAQQAMRDLNNTSNAVRAAADSNAAVIQRLQGLINNGTPAQKKAARNALARLSEQGWASGGFTGRGNANEIAGVVHRGEYVLPKSAVDQITGMPKLEGLFDKQATTTPVVVNLRHSKGAMRQAALDTIELVNEVYRARGQQQIGVQA